MSDNTINVTSPSGAPLTPDQVREQAEAQGIEIPDNTVFIDQRELQLIIMHGTILTTAKTLPEEEQTKIAQYRERLKFITDTDAGRVAFQLHSIELDENNLPYGDTFRDMTPLAVNDAMELWKAGK